MVGTLGGREAINSGLADIVPVNIDAGLKNVVAQLEQGDVRIEGGAHLEIAGLWIPRRLPVGTGAEDPDQLGHRSNARNWRVEPCRRHNR